jgi:hypothetical protein
MNGFLKCTAQRLIVLIQSALNETVPNEKLFAGMDESQWDNLLCYSAEQGVMALALDGSMHLPTSLQPPRTVKWRWIAGVEAVEKRYRHQLKVAEELTDRFKENNIQMLLFKGIALSRFYPNPEHREFGDIDIYLYGKADEGDAILRRMVKKDNHPSSKKHTGFSYKGLLIENHHTLLNQGGPSSFYNSDILEERLKDSLVSAGILENERPPSSGSPDEKPLFPTPDFDALFVMLHALGHFPAGIVFRHLCDLKVLFTTYRGKIDFVYYRDCLSKAGVLKVADALTALAVRYLGLNLECAPPYESNPELEEKIITDIMHPPIPPLREEQRTFFKVIIHKIKLICARYWKNELIFPGKFGKLIIHSASYHLLHPEVIRKLK